MQLEYEGPMTLRANQLFRAVLRITLNERLDAGARVVLAVRHVSDLGDPQMDTPAAENYISVTGSGEWKLGEPNDWKRHPWNRGIDLRLESGSLPAGETLTIVLGDQSQGSPGYRSQSFAETIFRFRLGICRDGGDNWSVLPVDSCPRIQVLGNQAVSLKVSVPRPTRGDGKLRVTVKPEDAYGNIAGDGPKEATILIDDHVPIGRVALPPGGCGGVTLDLPEVSNWQTVTVTTDDGRFMGRSNPFGPSPLEGYELFFGEIHCQSALCDGTNLPDELYRYARDAAGLDFASVTSHDFELTAEDWQDIRKATREAHVPGRFIAFLGVEWSGQSNVGGDNNIYFLDDDGPLVYSAPHGVYGAWDPAEGQVMKSQKLSKVIEQLEGRRFMVVPHCGGRCCNLDFYDPRVMPLFEIHSCHRTYQDIADESIRRGIRFGFIGGSDDHRGAPGDSHPAARERFFSSHNGLVAVYARKLTRESLWDAFFARRTYATNGARIVLTTEVDGHPLGSDVVAVPGAILKMSFSTYLDGLLDRVEVMRDDVLVQTFYGKGNQVHEFSGAMELRAAAEPHAHYVKVFQTDGGRAWSSPIWIVPPDA